MTWMPANDTEKALAEALSRGDQRGYYQVIVDCELYLPERVAARNRPGPQRFITAELLGQEYLPVFTSVPALAQVMQGQADAYTVTGYAELRAKWPNPQWRLAVNPGTPIDAYVTIDAVEQAAQGQLTVPTAADLAAQARQEAAAERPPGADLQAAIARQDVDGYLHALLNADVIVPVTVPVDAERIIAPGFPWRPAERAGSPVIEIFTSAATLPGPTDTVTVPFTAVLVGWPGDGYGLVVDPGTPLEMVVPAGSVHALVLWLPASDD
jgi:SseB protein N-terminal domain